MTAQGGQTLAWDIENRLTGVTGNASFVYDRDGKRVKKTESGQTTVYVNKYYEKNLTTGGITLYYYLGDRLVALKKAAPCAMLARTTLPGHRLRVTPAVIWWRP